MSKKIWPFLIGKGEGGGDIFFTETEKFLDGLTLLV